jgi:hypothetical protein
VPGCARALVIRQTSARLDPGRPEPTHRIVAHCDVVGFTDARQDQHIEMWEREKKDMKNFTLV